jgi:hypothetical protein
MYNVPDMKEKFLCATLYICPFLVRGSLAYLLISFAPVIYIVFCNYKKIYLKDFVKYHCFQALILNMIVFFLPDLFNLLIAFFENLFEVFFLAISSMNLPEEMSIGINDFFDSIHGIKSFILQIYQTLILVLTLYAIVWTARGKFTYIPPVSQAVNQLLR